MQATTTFSDEGVDYPPRNTLAVRLVQIADGLVWRLYFGVVSYWPFWMVQASTAGGLLCFVELAYGCSSFVRHDTSTSYGGNKAGAGPLFYGVWQQLDGAAPEDSLCRPHTTSSGGDTDQSLFLFSRAASVVGVLLGTAYLLFLYSIICIMYPRSKVRSVGGSVAILMILMTAIVITNGVWSSDMLCKPEVFNTNSVGEWLMSYTTNVHCSVRRPGKSVWLNVFCWGVAGLGTRWLGETSLTKCRFRGRNVANACRVETTSGGGGYPQASGIDEQDIDERSSMPPSFEDIFSCSSEPTAATTTSTTTSSTHPVLVDVPADALSLPACV